MTQVEKSLPKIAEQVLASQLQQNLQLTPYRDVMQRFLNKDLNWESLKDDVMTASTQEFTEQALKQLTVFYKPYLARKPSQKCRSFCLSGARLACSAYRLMQRSSGR